jgi:hypothetical protein
MIGVIVFGVIAFTRLGVSQMPDVDNPVLSMTTPTCTSRTSYPRSPVSARSRSADTSIPTCGYGSMPTKCRRRN